MLKSATRAKIAASFAVSVAVARRPPLFVRCVRAQSLDVYRRPRSTLSVSVYVCLLVTSVSPVKTDEPIEMPCSADIVQGTVY